MSKDTLSELFRVTGRFQRSVHLERDFYTEENALGGYVVTVSARATLTRLIDALENRATSNAWSLAGPYGSGKSAFALFAAKLLGNSAKEPTRQALKLLEHADRELYQRFINANGQKPSSRGFCPILISGERAPITLALLRGLEQGLAFFYGPLRSNPVLPQIKNLRKSAENGSPPQASDITAVFEAATQQISSDGGSGLLVVIDELGKFLEYAVQHPNYGDVFVLQDLAEFAARSGKTPLLLLTILHQAFEQYAQRAAKSQRDELAKVQGRFEDLAFIEPTEQVLRLIGEALTTRSEIVPEPGLAIAVGLELKPRQLDEHEFIQLLERCLPLHPTVALLIGPLFRRFAQNERSLFAFLGSNEPHGLQDFLFNQSYDGRSLPLFSLAHLYDYINIALGNRLYTSHEGKKWAEIASAIQRLPDPSPMTVRLIKTIGLLGAVGEVIPNLKASKQVLRYALDDDTAEFTEEFTEALETLERRSIVIYRRYNDAYALWEGSDIDIDAKLREASKHVDPNLRVATNLSRLLPQRPLVAKRHLLQTGTMRYFAVRYSDLENFEADLHAPLEDADGLILYALPESEEEQQLIKKAAAAVAANRKNVLIALPRSIGFLRDAVFDLACLRWVAENIPELQGDATAKRELSLRRTEARQEVSRQLTTIFGGNTESGCIWYRMGQPAQVHSQRTRNVCLSEICDAFYDKTPILRNELINRRKLSTQASAARKRLITAMLEKGTQKDLGISGYPPEMSIYLSLLVDTGIHREVLGVWEFGPPKKSDEHKMHPTWEAIEKFINECEVNRQPVVRLYERLEEPPFGLRRGPLPILLCAAMLHYDTELALYENGSFLADVSVPVFERLIKAPERFELKRFRIGGVRTEVFEHFSELFSQPAKPIEESTPPNLLTVVRPLMRFIAKLPPYAMLTQGLSDAAVAVRKTITDAREPDTLLFKDLPEALGLRAFGPETAEEDRCSHPNSDLDSSIVDKFFTCLRKALSELDMAYDKLLDFIKEQLVSVFALESSGEDIRGEIGERSQSLLELMLEPQLKAFLTRVCDDNGDFKAWLNAIGTCLAEKPPTSWNDTDKVQFEINLSEIARKFHHFCALSLECHEQSAESSEAKTIQVYITWARATERQGSITLQSHKVREFDREFERLLEEFDVKWQN